MIECCLLWENELMKSVFIPETCPWKIYALLIKHQWMERQTDRICAELVKVFQTTMMITSEEVKEYFRESMMDVAKETSGATTTATARR